MPANVPLDLITLRRVAEERFHGAAGAPPGAAAAGGTLEFELGVYDVELKMQNEALREANAELERARDRYRELYELAPVPYLTLSPTGEIIRANTATGRLLGVPVAQARGVALASFLLPEDAEVFELHRREVVGDGSATADLRMLSREGKQHDVRLESVCTDPDAQEWHTTLMERAGGSGWERLPARALRRTERGSTQFLRLDGSGVPLSTFELHWSERSGWAFTAIAETAVAGKIAAVRIFGTVRPVIIDKVHVAGERTSFAGRLPEPDAAP